MKLESTFEVLSTSLVSSAGPDIPHQTKSSPVLFGALTVTNAASSVSLTGDSHCDECHELGEPNWETRTWWRSGFPHATRCVTSKKFSASRGHHLRPFEFISKLALAAKEVHLAQSLPLGSLLFSGLSGLATSAELTPRPFLCLLWSERFTTFSHSPHLSLSLQTREQGRGKGLECIFFLLQGHN